MLQVQAAQQRALNTNMAAGGPNLGTPHLSPGFAQRAPVSSPIVSHSSPPRTSTTPNPPRPASASQHQAHGQPSPNLPHVAAARQNPAPGMYFPSLHGVQFTQEQMEHAMRLQLMVSGCLHMHCRPEASSAVAGLSSGATASGTGASGASSGSGPGSGSSSSPGTGRSTDWIVPVPDLKRAPFILRVNTIPHCSLQLYKWAEWFCPPPYGRPSR